MPMIAALGGATGNQMVTMIVRGLAVGEIHLRQVRVIFNQRVRHGFDRFFYDCGRDESVCSSDIRAKWS